jgi:hypothetical protein
MSIDVTTPPRRAQDLATTLPAGSPEGIDRDPSIRHTMLGDVATIESGDPEQRVNSRDEHDEACDAKAVPPTLRRSELVAPVFDESPGLATAVLLYEGGLHPVGLYPHGHSINEGNTNRTRTTFGKELIPIGRDRRPAATDLPRVWRIYPGAGVGHEPDFVWGVIDFKIDDPSVADPVIKRIFGKLGPPADVCCPEPATNDSKENSMLMATGRFLGKIRDCGFLEARSEGKHPQCFVTFDVLARIDAASGALIGVPSATRTYYKSTHPKSVAWLIADLKAIGYDKESFRFLDPEVEGAVNLFGREIEVTCTHEVYQGVERERWSITGGEARVKAGAATIARLDDAYPDAFAAPGDDVSPSDPDDVIS